MKRRELLQHLQSEGCEFVREGGGHTVWRNPQNGRRESVPRHQEIKTSFGSLDLQEFGCFGPERRLINK